MPCRCSPGMSKESKKLNLINQFIGPEDIMGGEEGQMEEVLKTKAEGYSAMKGGGK